MRYLILALCLLPLVALADINTAVMTSGNQTVNGVKTFSQPIAGSVTGDAGTLGGHDSTYFQPAATAITTGNIGAQSVDYAATAGDAPDLTGRAVFQSYTSLPRAATTVQNTWAVYQNFSGGMRAADITAGGPWVDARYAGVPVDGVTDAQPAMQALVDALADSGNHTINLFDQTVYFATPVQLRPGISVINGTVKGSFYIGSDAQAGVQPTNFRNPRIENIHFVQDTLVSGTYAIKYQMAQFAGFVRGCTFDNIDKAIWVPTFTVSVPDQIVHRLTVVDNKYNNCNYFIKTEKPSLHNYGMADLTVSNNVGYANVTNLRLEGIDGAIIQGNTFFMAHYTAQDATKEYNVYIDFGSWIDLTGNNYFESGLSAIILKHTSDTTISGGRIAYAGERVLSDGIQVQSGDISGARNGNITIDGIVIKYPSRSGISVDLMSGNINITGVLVHKAGFATTYYGATDITSVPHYGFDIDDESQFVKVTDTNTPFNTNNLNYNNFGEGENYFAHNLDSTGYAVEKPNVVTLSGTETAVTSVGAKGITRVYLNQSGATTVTSVPAGVDGAAMLFVALNGNTTLQDSSTFRLQGRVNSTVPAGGTLVMEWVTDTWREISRNYPATQVVVTFSGVETSVAAGTTQVNLNQSGATTITTLPTGTEGQTILFKAFNGNSTLQSSATVYLQDGINATLPTNGSLLVRWVSSKWIEVSRNFNATSSFASLGTVPTAGTTKYCTDCTTAATCAGSGTGHMAVSNGTNWTCQ